MSTVTETRTSFWDGNHPQQDEYQNLWDTLVPGSGEADTVEGEAIRAVGRLFYEYCNNGNCNAAERSYETEYETCHSCQGSGTVEEYTGEEDEDGDEIYEDVECDDCCGCGEVEEEVEGELEINDYYGNMLEFIEEHVPESLAKVEAVRDLIMSDSLHYNYNYDDSEMTSYNELTELVVNWVTSKNGNYTKR